MRKNKCFKFIIILSVFIFFGCSTNSVEKEIERKTIGLLEAMVEHSWCHEEEEINKRTDAYREKYKQEHNGESIYAFPYKDVWPEYYEEHERIFSEFVTDDCYIKMIKSRKFLDPSYVSDSYEAKVDSIDIYDNSILVNCTLVLDNHSKKMILIFTENNNEYLVSSMNIRIAN